MKALYHLFLVLLIACMGNNIAYAQGKNNFDPAKFKADKERFITAEAHLTATEATAYFRLYDEMFQKQRKLYEKMRNLKKVRPATDEKCKAAIMEMDRLEIEIDELQAAYHNKFLKILSPGKLFDAIQAESRFHRKAMREAGAKK